MTPKEREFIRQLCLEDFWSFVNIIILPVAVPNTKDQKRLDLKPFHKDILRSISRLYVYRHGILMPRYFGKSTNITCAKPIWDWLRNHEERILIANETYIKAQSFLNTIKNHLENNAILHYFFPESKISPKWKSDMRWSGDAIDLPREGIYADPTIRPIGVGGSYQGIHVSKAYFDDLIGKKARDSLKVRQDTAAWFDNSDELLVEPDPNSPNASSIYVIGTNWAPGDLYCKIEERFPIYEWKKVSAEVDDIPTWPEKLSKTEIERMKSDPQKAELFYAQMQNNPKKSMLIDFKEEWLKYYTNKKMEDKDVISFIDQENKRQDVFVKELDICAVIEPSSFGYEKSKYYCRTAIIIVGTDPKTNNHFVLEAILWRPETHGELYGKIVELHRRYYPRIWGIETFRGGDEIYKGFLEYLQREGAHVPIRELDKDVSSGAKNNRIRNNLQEEFARGYIYFHKSQTGIISEYITFPNGDTNDGIDGLSYHKQWWTSRDVVKDRKNQVKRRAMFRRKRSRITGY